MTFDAPTLLAIYAYLSTHHQPAARALAERVHAAYLAIPTDPTEGENHE